MPNGGAPKQPAGQGGALGPLKGGCTATRPLEAVLPSPGVAAPVAEQLEAKGKSELGHGLSVAGISKVVVFVCVCVCVYVCISVSIPVSASIATLSAVGISAVPLGLQ